MFLWKEKRKKENVWGGIRKRDLIFIFVNNGRNKWIVIVNWVKTNLT